MDEMRLRLQYVEETLAMSEFHKGNFYYKKKLYKASTGRFRDCVQNFTRFGKRDEVLFMLADSLDHQRNYDESSLYYSQIVRGYPFSDYFEDSRERLQQLEKPIPEVDEALAAENLETHTVSQTIWKSSFSGLFGLFGGGEKPWKDFEKERREAEKEKLKSYEVTKN
jgi:outer membrane protein assembly factor BamD (BamD/ComL family)